MIRDFIQFLVAVILLVAFNNANADQIDAKVSKQNNTQEELSITDAQDQFMMGMKYYHAQGVPRDYAKAFFWFKKAAEQGQENSQMYLGIMYENGQGTNPDLVMAYAWTNIIASSGNSADVEFLDRLEKKMTASQIMQAQEISSGWSPGKRLQKPN